MTMQDYAAQQILCYRESLQRGLVITFPVVTSSMYPLLSPRAGARVTVVACEHAAIRVGDMIAYEFMRTVPIVCVHRVMRIVRGPDSVCFVTKGDANRRADTAPVQAAQVLGVVCRWELGAFSFQTRNGVWRIIDRLFLFLSVAGVWCALLGAARCYRKIERFVVSMLHSKKRNGLHS